MAKRHVKKTKHAASGKVLKRCRHAVGIGSCIHGVTYSMPLKSRRSSRVMPKLPSDPSQPYETDFRLQGVPLAVATDGEVPYWMHGLSDDTGEPYSVVVFAFHMVPISLSWRILEVHSEATFEFIEAEEHPNHPEVMAFAPKSSR